MNVLITGAWRHTDGQLQAIRELGNNVIFMQNETDALPCPAEEIEAVICNGLFLHHPIEKFISLKYIQLTSAGFDRVPMDYVKEHGITINNARGVYSIPMAEFALSGVLQLYKQGKFFAEHQKKHQWDKHAGLRELYEKHVLIVGCGSVGDECAKRFSVFGCVVTGIDVFPHEKQPYSAVYSLEKLDKVLPDSDIVVLTLPLTEKTKHLINAERITYFKPGMVLVNIARGAVLDTGALIEALSLGKLSGAVLDVFEQEPLFKDSPLWDMENVILTPHNSFVGEHNSERLFAAIYTNLKANQVKS